MPFEGTIVGCVDDPLIRRHIQDGFCLQSGHIAAMVQLRHCKAPCTPTVVWHSTISLASTQLAWHLGVGCSKAWSDVRMIASAHLAA